MKTKLVSLGAAAAIAVASYFTYGTPLEDAIAIATNSDKAKAACARLVDADKAPEAGDATGQ